MTQGAEALHPQRAAERQRLYLHIGLPKSGSTYLQTVLGNNRGALRDAGHVYPYVRQEGMFLAAVEMAGSPARWGLDPDDIRGTFAHLLRRGRRLGGTVVLSHEVFGAASDAQVAVIADLLAEFDVHIVVTARDLGRTMTAGWQEHVKNGHPGSFREFSDALLADLHDRPADTASFWPPQNLVAVLERWRLLAPPERMHVVTCPPSGAAPDLLWRRFAEAIDLAADAVDLSDVPARNESLGTAQIAFLRRVVVALDGRLEQPWFSRVAKRWFAQTLLTQGPSGKPVTPPAVVERLGGVSATWVARIREGGYQVHGDLTELMPQAPGPGTPHPDDVSEADLVRGLPEVVAEMLLRTRQLNAEIEDLREAAGELGRERDALANQVVELTDQMSHLSTRLLRSRLRRWRSRLPGRSAAEPGNNPAGP